MMGSMSSNEKADGSNYDVWNLRVQFTLNKGDMLDHFTTFTAAPAGKGEQGKDVTTNQYNKNLKANHTWFKGDHFVRYTMLSCMHVDLLGEFEHFSTAKDMQAQLK